MALAFGLFDRILFSMKVKKSHLPVLAAASVSLASKTLEDERCANLGKYLVKASGALFSVVSKSTSEIISKDIDQFFFNSAIPMCSLELKKVNYLFLEGKLEHMVIFLERGVSRRVFLNYFSLK